MTVEVPEPLAGRLAAEAERRGVSAEAIAVEALEGFYGRSATGEGASDSLATFLGSGDSGDPDWASRDIHELRADAASRKIAEGA